MTKTWTELGRIGRTFRCEDTTGVGTQCRRKASWRYGLKGSMAELVVCGTHKAQRDRKAGA